ncbi:iron complex outermembrane recepter protein [Paracidovorax valerianellae]|uniref:Iron complex outermembrane recepter protein n=2 Tax=Paracidovorax valerianellae TaxID=187868 RepID=A0A1G6PRN1_9BURK|nr:iron complex outermembrane recepter protein [Paracidovorax valerianellae]
MPASSVRTGSPSADTEARLQRRLARSPLAHAVLALLASVASPAASAQEGPSRSVPTLAPVTVSDTPAEPMGRLNLDTPAETGSRLGLTPRETPASVTVVDRATIEARGAQDTQEILRAVPGVTVHNAPGSMAASYRGFNNNSVTQLFNGITVQYGSATRAVDSWIYDRVEAIGGASGFLYGAGAVGGSLNFITKTPDRSGDFTEGRLRLGSYGLKEASVGINRRIAGPQDGSAAPSPGSSPGPSPGPSHYVRLDVNHRDAGSWTTGTQTRSTQLAASLLSDLGGGFTHLLAYEFQKETVDRPYWGTPVLNPSSGALRIDPGTRFANYNSADGMYAQRVQWLRSMAQWRVSDALQWRNTLYAYDALRDYRNVETYQFNAANTLVSRGSAFLQRHDQQLVGNRTEATWHGTLAGRQSDWAFGLDVSVNRQTRFPNSLSGTVSTVDPYRFTTERFFDIPGMAPGFRADRDNRVQTTAVFAENRTALVPGVHLVTALRHERIALEVNNRRAITATSPAAFDRSYTPTTGRLGVVWDVAPGANVYAQYATAGDPPSGSLSTASFADVANNSALTTGRQAEVGSKFDFWGGRGTATVAAFQITRRNIASQDPNNPAFTVQVGEQSSRGVEVAAGLRLTDRWQVQANAMRARARYEQFVQGGVSLAGRTPINTPESVANLWLGYAITPALQATAGVRRVGRIYADAANTQYWPSYTLLDLGLAWKLSPTATLTGRIRNATDRIYAAEARSAQVYLGAPRTADVSLQVAF